jgi:hypothetical protein
MNSRLLTTLALLVTPALLPAQPFVEHVAPPVAERGKTARVAFVGRELAGALDVWTSLPPGAVKAKPVESGPGRAVFDVEVSANAPVGVCGLRVATRDGLSNSHLFLIDDLPVRAGATTDEPIAVSLPAAVWGTFREAGIDRYRVAVKAGQRVSFEAVGSRLGKDADPLVTIRGANGKWVAERDNDPGLYYDCRFAHAFKDAGTYTVEVSDARYRGSVHHQYVLRMGRFPAGRVAVPAAVKPGRNELHLPEMDGAVLAYEYAPGPVPGPFFGALRRPDDEGSSWLPLAPTDGPITVARERDEARAQAQARTVLPAVTLACNWSPLRASPFLPLDVLLPTGRAQAIPAAVPGVLCGVLRKPGERHAFLFELAKGQTIYVRGEAQALNSPADLDIVLTDRFGKEVRRANEQRGELTLDFAAGSPGTFGLLVRDAQHDGGDAFAYRLTVRDKPFPPALTAEVEGLTVPQSSYQPVPLVVTRTAGNGPIKLKLLGDTAGLKLTPDEIGEKDAAVVCNLEAEGGASLGVRTIQILAETANGPTLVRTQPLIDKQLINVDLIPLALREDQKRLPPTLADRLAVQVTPPAPFTFDLPEAQVTLPRYQSAPISVITTRIPGCDSPITFTAKGGQLADKNEGRTRVYADFPVATANAPRVAGRAVSKILSNIGKTRIEVTATAAHQGRHVRLTRTFELNLTTAFTMSAEPAKLALLPGETATVRLLANRLKSFDGAVTVHLAPVPGVVLPPTVVIPKGQSGVDVPIAVEKDTTARKQNLQMTATATVDGFEEEVRFGALELEVKKVEDKKKK